MEYKYRFHKFLTGHLMEVSGQLQDIEKGPPATAYKDVGAKAPEWVVLEKRKPSHPCHKSNPKSSSPQSCHYTMLFHLPPTEVIKKVKRSCYRPGVAQRVCRGIALLFHDSGTRRGEWSAARPRAGLDRRKISSPPGFNPGLSSPQSVTIPTELPGPPY